MNFDLGWPYYDMTLGYIYIQTNMSCCDGQTYVVTTLLKKNNMQISEKYIENPSLNMVLRNKFF
jgi:hypothetical protein